MLRRDMMNSGLSRIGFGLVMVAVMASVTSADMMETLVVDDVSFTFSDTINFYTTSPSLDYVLIKEGADLSYVHDLNADGQLHIPVPDTIVTATLTLTFVDNENDNNDNQLEYVSTRLEDNDWSPWAAEMDDDSISPPLIDIDWLLDGELAVGVRVTNPGSASADIGLVSSVLSGTFERDTTPETVPLPSALVLGSLGLGFAGWLRRKQNA